MNPTSENPHLIPPGSTARLRVGRPLTLQSIQEAGKPAFLVFGWGGELTPEHAYA